MRCADFRVFSLRVQGPQPLQPTAQVILPSCHRQRPWRGLPGIVAPFKFAPMREQRKPSFERMEATLLACPQCKRAVKVRKRLLLVLPQGDKYLYVCPDCGSTCGETIETPSRG